MIVSVGEKVVVVVVGISGIGLSQQLKGGISSLKVGRGGGGVKMALCHWI